MRVIDMLPGERVAHPRDGFATFIAQVPHPRYTNLQLVVWRRGDGTVLEALAPTHDVGRAKYQTPDERRAALEAAL